MESPDKSVNLLDSVKHRLTERDPDFMWSVLSVLWVNSMCVVCIGFGTRGEGEGEVHAPSTPPPSLPNINAGGSNYMDSPTLPPPL